MSKNSLEKIILREEDLQESFVCSSAPGGQNVNKVATCVVLKHLPTGIVVKCQMERSQHLNRQLARQILLKKLQEREDLKLRRKIDQIEKVKRSKRKRPQSLKEEILKNKKQVSEKKQLRKKIRLNSSSYD